MVNEGKHYIRTMQAWYANSQPEHRWVEEIYFYNDDPYGEMAMRWYDLGSGNIAPRLEVYLQSAFAYMALTNLQSILAHISAEKGNIDPEQFCRILDRCGFVDKTPRRYEESYPYESEQPS